MGRVVVLVVVMVVDCGMASHLVGGLRVGLLAEAHVLEVAEVGGLGGDARLGEEAPDARGCWAPTDLCRIGRLHPDAVGNLVNFKRSGFR